MTVLIGEEWGYMAANEQAIQDSLLRLCYKEPVSTEPEKHPDWCCTPQDCLAQAAELASAIAQRISGMREGHSQGSSLGNVFGTGWFCYDWAKAVCSACRETAEPHMAAGDNCFKCKWITDEIDEDNWAEHNWVGVYGPGNWGGYPGHADFYIDPWPTGGRACVYGVDEHWNVTHHRPDRFSYQGRRPCE